MSVLLILQPNSQARSSKGFTLLELLTVLFVIGLTASLVLPNLPTLYERLSYALDRDSVIRNLNRLPYIAAESNRDYVLFGDIQTGMELDSSSPLLSSDDLPPGGPFRSGQLRQALPELPTGWVLSVSEPIFYRSSGFCSGGRVTVTVGSSRYDLVGDAPSCQFKEADP